MKEICTKDPLELLMEGYAFWRNVVLYEMALELRGGPSDAEIEAHWANPGDTPHTGELWHCINCGTVYCEDCLDWTKECYHCYCPCEPGEYI